VQCQRLEEDVSGWTGITQVSAGIYHTVGLKADGTVVAVGSNDAGQCNVGGWDLN
jgi:alpha-tubulin suppressor-like RCC1 family protein